MNLTWKLRRYGLTILILTVILGVFPVTGESHIHEIRNEGSRKTLVRRNSGDSVKSSDLHILNDSYLQDSLSGNETCGVNNVSLACVQEKVYRYIQNVLDKNVFQLVDGVWIEKVSSQGNDSHSQGSVNNTERSDDQRAIAVNLYKLFRNVRDVNNSPFNGRTWFSSSPPEDNSGKSSFMAGFGVGFLTFALKKLLLPIFLGAQIVKSVLIAMFLPSILGGLGKLVGKGVTTFASSSGSSGGGGNNGGGTSVEDFEFKDNFDLDHSTAESSYSGTYTYPEPAFAGVSLQNNALPVGTLPASSLYMPSNSPSSSNKDQHSSASSKVSYISPTSNHHYGSYYTKHATGLNAKQSYKVFHNIPTSSLLLTNYDPFYSPLLSRLDSVFKQLGYDTESCRERLVCSMYRNPAKFAPFSNLVSAQLSRELNELRKPSTDNPEILRFFRYMKAAKDGQDGLDCFRLHPGCSGATVASTSPPMVKTFNDINKLVHARKLHR